MSNFIRSLANDQTQNNIKKNNIKKGSDPTTDNQINISYDKLKEKEKEITELRARLNNFNNMKTKVENKNNEISRLKNELDRITYLNNSQKKQISSLKKELEKAVKPNNVQENEIIRLRNELDQTINLKQFQENQIIRLKNELDQAKISIQARILEEIEESSFFEPNEIRNSNTTPIKIVIEEKPSFNCKGVLKWDEKVICNNPSLAEWDRKVSNAYQNALASTHDNKAKNKLIANQENWLYTRHQCKEDYDKTLCLKKEYIKQWVFLQGKYKSKQNALNLDQVK